MGPIEKLIRDIDAFEERTGKQPLRIFASQEYSSKFLDYLRKESREEKEKTVLLDKRIKFGMIPILSVQDQEEDYLFGVRP